MTFVIELVEVIDEHSGSRPPCTARKPSGAYLHDNSRRADFAVYGYDLQGPDNYELNRLHFNWYLCRDCALKKPEITLHLLQKGATHYGQDFPRP